MVRFGRALMAIGMLTAAGTALAAKEPPAKAPPAKAAAAAAKPSGPIGKPAAAKPASDAKAATSIARPAKPDGKVVGSEHNADAKPAKPAKATSRPAGKPPLPREAKAGATAPSPKSAAQKSAAQKTAARSQERTLPARAEPLPGDAVRAGDDITMHPNGQDATGCRRYSMSSRGNGSLQAVFYRTAKGDFTTDRSEAACSG